HMPFVGPNCYGIINMNVGSVMWPDFHGLTRVHNGVAIITQSGNIAINLTMQKRGLPISYIMTMGNQAMVGISDVMQVMADDPHVKAIGLHIEGFGDINHFIAAVRYCHSRGKPVSVLKTGLSTKGAELTMSHTASLAGSGASAGAFLQRLGVPQMHDVPAFLEMLKLQMAFGLTPLPALPQRQPNSINLISFSCSGGEATLMADLAESLNKDSATDIIFPPLSQPARDKLFALHGDKVSLNNPFDYQTYIWGNEQQLRDNFAFALETPVDYGLLVLDIPNRPDMDSWAWRQTHEGFMAGITANHRRGIIVASMVENLPDEKTCHAMLAAGIAPLAGFASTLRLLQQSAAWSLPATNSDD
ncbi:MAG: CoA-binding protein, partial [Alphaproteobacteria bacterium]|nr:CoA-binding protein [Alphaproteobacteria bacterium]